VDRINRLEGVRADIAILRTPDGSASPSAVKNAVAAARSSTTMPTLHLMSGAGGSQRRAGRLGSRLSMR
jgi:hypothetical protein